MAEEKKTISVTTENDVMRQGEPFDLTVHFKHIDAGVDWGGRTSLDIILIVFGSDLSVDPPVRRVTLIPDTDIPPVVYMVTARSSGTKTAVIMIQLAREMTLLQEYELTLEVLE